MIGGRRKEEGKKRERKGGEEGEGERQREMSFHHSCALDPSSLV